MKDRRRSVGAGIMRKISQLDDNQLSSTKGASDPRCGHIYPISPACALMKETTPWEFAAIGGADDKPKHALSNISNVQRVTIDDGLIAYLYEIAVHPKTGIERKIRMYRLRNHRDSFWGSDAVDWFMKTLVVDRQEGVAIGEALMHRGLITHVLRCEPFQDSKNSLYRFAEITVLFFTIYLFIIFLGFLIFFLLFFCLGSTNVAGIMYGRKINVFSGYDALGCEYYYSTLET
jgi:hypothetical protein